MLDKMADLLIAADSPLIVTKYLGRNTAGGRRISSMLAEATGNSRGAESELR